jgi:hypothetical protein
MRNVSYKGCRENPNILCSITCFFFLIFFFYFITWKNIIQPYKPQTTIRFMRIECWTTKATDTHSECVILIALPRQQWFHENPSMVRLYIHACPVKLLFLHFRWTRNFPEPLFPFCGNSELRWTLFWNRFSRLFSSCINPVILQTAYNKCIDILKVHTKFY